MWKIARYFHEHKITVTLVIIFCIYFITGNNIQWGKDNYINILEWDAVGYYSYLPAIFHYHDLHFSFIDTHPNYFISDAAPLIKAITSDGTVNRYYIGTSYFMAPFYFIARLTDLIFNNGANDPYSKIYMICVNMGAITYLMLSLYILSRCLKKFYNISDIVCCIVLLSFALGTNLFFYALFQPGMSHIYSFFCVTVFTYLILSFHQRPAALKLFLIIVTLACIVLIRPVNLLVVLLIPFFLGRNTVPTLIIAFKYYWKSIVAGTITALLMLLPQLYFYKAQTGHYLVYSYGNDHYFDWFTSHFIDILFSYRKGLFLYMPLLFVSMFGLHALYKKDPICFYSWIFSFILITYVLSSWSCWSYGGCFGNRAFIEYYILFIIPLALWIEALVTQPLKKYLTISLLFCIIIICQIQTYQYRYFFIHWDEMNKERYWKVFLRIDYLIDKKDAFEILEIK